MLKPSIYEYWIAVGCCEGWWGEMGCGAVWCVEATRNRTRTFTALPWGSTSSSKADSDESTSSSGESDEDSDEGVSSEEELARQPTCTDLSLIVLDSMFTTNKQDTSNYAENGHSVGRASADLVVCLVGHYECMYIYRGIYMCIYIYIYVHV